MSLPPSTIHIKRKATDDPVDFLRVHELNSKRQRRASEFVFTRQSVEKDTTQSQPTPAGVRCIKELPRAGSAPSLSSPATKPLDTREGRSEAVAEQASETSTLRTTAIDSQQIPTDNASKDTTLQVSRQRRFHISRPSTPIPGQSPVIGGRVQKRTPTVFVERRSRPTSSKGGNQLDLNTQTSLFSISSSQKDQFGLIETPLGHTVQSSTAVPAEAGQSRSQKKPGLAARTSLNGTSSIPTTPLTPSIPARNVRLPSGLVMPWDVTSDQLAKEMQEYTLQQIGLSIAETQTNSSKPILAPAPRKATISKFKPKKPAARYHERHPDKVPLGSIDVDEPYLDNDDLDDDGDYVIDTYIRMPADEVELDKTNDFGLLVLESQPDFEEFYREDSDHDTEEEDEEEDENAEDHYTADYPEDEVDSDDEYNRNAYHYRNNNASDDEEFDENDDDNDNATRYPWSKSMQTYGAGPLEYDDTDGDDDDVDDPSFHSRAADTHEPLAKIFKDLTTSEEKHEHQGVAL